ncbi:MAG: hypothetical protein IT303_14610 [Dehalococcoidia bacterium]|nr:hypothetical protein [Dehalococcoidia bacterium]
MTSEQPPAEQLPSPSPKEKAASVAGEAVDWVRAIGLGIRDTAKDMLEAGRKGAHDAYGEGWDRFDAKVKKGRHRRS